MGGWKIRTSGLDREGETCYIYAHNVSANIPIHLIKSLLNAIFNSCDGNLFSSKTDSRKKKKNPYIVETNTSVSSN